MYPRRVVVTGLGIVSPLGHSVGEVWQNLQGGCSGIVQLDHLPQDDLRTYMAGLVQNFDPTFALATKEIRQFDKFIQYGVVAASQAITDAKLELDHEDTSRIGVALGSGIGGLTTLEHNHSIALEKGSRRIWPSFIPGTIINSLPGLVSVKYGFRGPNLSLVSACATGTHNIGCAAQWIAYGDVDVMLVGGAEKASTLLGMGGFSSMRALSTRNDEPQKASRPWDSDRDGFVLGDGAGVLILEDYEHAKQRGAHIYAELSGFGMSADAYHMTLPHLEGQVSAMHLACQKARIQPQDIDYINAHATSTPAGDMVELQAISALLGQDNFGRPAISSSKSMTGHLLGAAGAVEAIFAILAIVYQVAPPTINLDTPEQGCEGFNLITESTPMKIRYALSNSFGFGGTNASLIFKLLEQD